MPRTGCCECAVDNFGCRYVYRVPVVLIFAPMNKKVIAETSVARFEYERGPNVHTSVPGCFSVYDKVREEPYWAQDCYDGGQGFSNLDEADVQREGIGMFLQINSKYVKLWTAEDQGIIAGITKPVSVLIDNPVYYGKKIVLRAENSF